MKSRLLLILVISTVAAGCLALVAVVRVNAVIDRSDVQLGDLSGAGFGIFVESSDDLPADWAFGSPVPSVSGAWWRRESVSADMFAYIDSYGSGIEAWWARSRGTELQRWDDRFQSEHRYPSLEAEGLPPGNIWCLSDPSDQECRYWAYLGWAGRDALVVYAEEVEMSYEEFHAIVESAFIAGTDQATARN
jgi:hypothetical protein